MIYITREDFPEIFRMHVNTVHRIAFSIVRNHEEAEDIVMECFTDLISKGEFSDEQHIKAWLIRVAENKAKNVMRSARVRRNISFDDLTGELSAPQEQPVSEVLDMVLRLPDGLKTVMYMFYYEDIPADRISKVLGISENAVYKRLTKGRRLLKMAMEEGNA